MVTPKGKLIPIGGSENKDCRKNGDCTISFYNTGILKRLLSEMSGNDSRLELIPTASGIPQEVAQRYIRAFNKLGCNNVGVIPVQKKKDACNRKYTERIERADGVFFTGGDQSRLGMFFQETPLVETITRRYLNDDFVIAGTSAGAMAMSCKMITGGPATSFKKGCVRMSTGLSFIENVIIDTHFIERGRFGRLTRAVEANPGCIGIGLGEDTGLILSNGYEIEIIGSGQVIILDGHYMKEAGKPRLAVKGSLPIENMAFHVLSMQDKYCLKARSIAQNKAVLVS